MNLGPALCASVYIPATLRDKTLSLPSFKFLKEQLKLEIVKRIRAGSLSNACFVSSAFKSRVSFESRVEVGAAVIGIPFGLPMGTERHSRNLIAY